MRYAHPREEKENRQKNYTLVFLACPAVFSSWANEAHSLLESRFGRFLGVGTWDC